MSKLLTVVGLLSGIENPHREPSGVERDDFVGGLSVGMRLHVRLSIELLFATLPQFLKHKSARNGANRGAGKISARAWHVPARARCGAAKLQLGCCRAVSEFVI